MITPPPVRFTRSGDADLAYQVMGDGPRQIVLMIGWVSHLEVLWELPEARRFLDRLAAIGRVALFDKRGTGLSDRSSQPSSTAQMVPDVLAVMEGAGMSRAVLVGWVDAATLALEVAARHPDRVEALVLGETLATSVPAPDHPWGANPQILGAVAEAIEQGAWGDAMLLPLIAPSQAGDERVKRWFQRLERMSATPSLAANLLRRTLETDVRPLLASVTAPALVVHRREAAFLPGEGMRWLADQLPGGRYVEVAGDAVPAYLGDVDSLMDEVEDFLVGTRSGGEADRQVKTVMFSDVAGSTEMVATLGDRRWRHLRESILADTEAIVSRFGGRLVDTAGDGVFVVFHAPSAAVRSALALREAGRASGVDLRIGIHVGEVVEQGESVTGLAVHIGARVTAAAHPGEVMVSQTVRDMLLGTGMPLIERGRHQLKGVPGDWHLWAVDPVGTAPAVGDGPV